MPAPEPAADGDWAVETADRIDAFVNAVRNRTTVPLTRVARAIVYGIVAGVMAAVALTLLAIGLLRVLDVYLPGNVWSAHLFLGLVFTTLGLLVWRQRRPKDETSGK